MNSVAKRHAPKSYPLAAIVTAAHLMKLRGGRANEKGTSSLVKRDT